MRGWGDERMGMEDEWERGGWDERRVGDGGGAPLQERFRDVYTVSEVSHVSRLSQCGSEEDLGAGPAPTLSGRVSSQF